MKIITRTRMRCVFHLFHTAIGFILGYGAALFILSEINIGHEASLEQRKKLLEDNKQICYYIGVGGGAIFLVGSIFLVRIRYTKHLKNLESLGEDEQKPDDSETEPVERSEAGEEAPVVDTDDQAADKTS